MAGSAQVGGGGGGGGGVVVAFASFFFFFFGALILTEGRRFDFSPSIVSSQRTGTGWTKRCRISSSVVWVSLSTFTP